LADAYGYSAVLPSTLDTAHVTLDSETGTLLVQGLPDAVNQDIELNLVGANIEVLVGSTTELVPSAAVTKIVIAKNGGDYDVLVDTSITQPRQDVLYVVSSNQDAVDSGTIGDGLVDLDSTVAGNQVTLRAAVQDANGAGDGAIYVPRGNYQLTLPGSGGDAQGDLDITGDVKIIGAGPGATVIRAPASDRHFEVAATGTLAVERLTLTGGDAGSGTGASIYVNARSTPGVDALTVTEAAIVNNESAFSGGGVFVGAGATARIERSVVVNDEAYYGGGIAANADSTSFAVVTLAESIVANNSTTMGDADLASGVSGANVGKFISEGHNLIGHIGSTNFTPLTSDHESLTGVVDYVVTSVRDTYDADTNGEALMSLREAIGLANTKDDVAEEIWVPAWTFLLTRQSSSPGAADNDIAFGDLEVSDSLTIRGAGSAPVQVKQTIAAYQDFDAAFDLLGDFTGNGTVSDDGDVDGGDYLIWQVQNSSSGGNFAADADDDHDVDADDLAIWSDGYGDLLLLINVA
jgi:hypothetical protein